MPAAERTARMRGMRRSIRREDVFRWVDSFLRAAIARDLRAFPAARRRRSAPAGPAADLSRG